MENKTINLSHSKTIFLVGLMFCMVLFLGNFVSSFDFTTELKAYYDMNDNQDSSGNGKHLTHGTGGYSSGKIGNALNNTYIYGEFTDFGLNTSSTDIWSISLWTQKYSTGSQIIFGFDDALGTNYGLGTVGQGILGHFASGTRWQGGVNDFKNITNILDSPPTGWRHIVLVKNATSFKIYINNSLKQTISIGTWSSGNIRELLIGSATKTLGGSLRWKGKIDEVGIWQREITSSEVAELYNGGSGLAFLPIVILNNPTSDEVVLTNEVTFNATGTIVGGFLVNATLYTNETGTWAIKNVTLYNGGTTYNPQSYLNPDNAFDNNGLTYANYTSGSVGSATTYLGKTFPNRYYVSVPIKAFGSFSGSGDGGCSNFINITLQSYNGVSWTNEDSNYENWCGTGSRSKSVDETVALNKNVQGLRIQVITNSGSGTWIHNHRIYTLSNFTNLLQEEQVFTNTYASGDSVLWNMKFCDSTGVCDFAPADYTFSIDAAIPTVSISAPVSLINYAKLGENLTVNFTATDTSIDKCWIDYSGINTTIPCVSGVLKSTNITLTTSKTLRVYVNDTTGNKNYDTKTWDYNLFENNRTYSSSTTSGALELFAINLTYKASYSGISVLMNYNNTNYTMSTNDTGTTRFYSKYLTIPTLDTSVNNSLYFIVLLSNSSGTFQINTDSVNQSVSPFLIDNCAVYTKVLMNMTMKDEERLVGINGTIEVLVNLYASGTTNLVQSYNKSYNYISPTPARVCINDETGTYDLSYQILYYSNSSYFKKYKTIQKLEITPSTYTQNIILYDLLKSSGETFNVIVVGNLINTNGNADLLVDTQRQYLSQNQFYSIESSVTDSEGTAITHLVESDQIYNFIVSYNGEVLGTFNNYRVKCQNQQTGQCSITLNLARATGSLDSFEDYGNISQTFLLDTPTNILYQTWSSTNGEVHIVNSLVIKADGYGNTTICNNTATGTSGTIQCNIPVIYQNTSFFVQTTVDGVLIGSKFFSQGVDPNWYGADIFIELLMLSSIVLLFLSHPITIILGAIIGLVSPILLLYVTGVSFSAIMGATIFYVVAGIIAIIVIRRKM